MTATVSRKRIEYVGELDFSPYVRAQYQARLNADRLEVEAGRRIAEALERFLGGLSNELRDVYARLPAADLRRVAAELSVAVVQEQIGDLNQALTNATRESRQLSFVETMSIWESAGRAVARSAGVDLALSGAVRIAPVSMLGFYENLNPARTWRTALPQYVQGAGKEIASTIRSAMIEDIGPDELARRLRRYVAGSEPFDKAFKDMVTRSGETVSKIDLRGLTKEERGAAGRMKSNAQRIAFSELHNARAEAELQHFIADPYVEAVRWELSPNRGSLKPPDVCDMLAKSDLYGLGAGIYPVAKVPPPPHPYDRCERTPVTRENPEAERPNPERKRAFNKLPIPGPNKVPAARAKALRNETERVVRFAEIQHAEHVKRQLALRKPDLPTPTPPALPAQPPVVAPKPPKRGGAADLPAAPQSLNHGNNAIAQYLDRRTPPADVNQFIRELAEVGDVFGFGRDLKGNVNPDNLSLNDEGLNSAGAVASAGWNGRLSLDSRHTKGLEAFRKEWFLQRRRGDSLSMDATRAFSTLMHEFGHFRSYDRARIAKKELKTTYNTQEGRWLEEGLVELNARRTSSRLLYGEATVQPRLAAVGAYNDEVRSLEFIAANFGDGAVDDIWKAKDADRVTMFASLTREAVGQAIRQQTQISEEDRNKALSRLSALSDAELVLKGQSWGVVTRAKGSPSFRGYLKGAGLL